MRISSTLPLTNFSQIFQLKKLSPRFLRDSCAQAPMIDRQGLFPLAYWTKGPLQIFVVFDLQKGAVTKVYQNDNLLDTNIQLHLPLCITRGNLHQAQQTLAQMSLDIRYKERTLHLTPHLKLCAGGDNDTAHTTQSLAALCKDGAMHPHLALLCIQVFKEGPKRPQDIAELVELARSQEVVRAVLAALLKPLKEKTLFDPLLMQGLARVLEYADPKHLSHADLVAILDYLRERLSKLSSADEKRLIQELAALSSLLNAMVAVDVYKIDRERIHERAMKELRSFTKHRCEEVALLAKSCQQALVRLPSNESKLHNFLRRALHAGEGLSLLSRAWDDKSLHSAIEAFHEFHEAFKPEEGKESWYDRVQFANLLIRQERYEDAHEIAVHIPKYTYCISACIHSLPKQRRALAKHHLPALPPCSLICLSKAGVALIHKARTALPWRLHLLKQERLTLPEDEKLYIPLDGMKTPYAQERLNLLDEAHAFLTSDQTVLLIQGGSGSGKSTFLHTLERKCWEQEERLPLHIHLGRIDPQSPHIIEDTLTSLHFKEEQIADLKTRHLVVFLDGYDEMPQGQLVNLYEHGGIKEWNAQVVISCRSQHIANVHKWEHYFAPFEGEAPNQSALKTLYVAPFSPEQTHSYLEAYLTANPTPDWTVERFMETIAQIKGLKDLIEAPFILHITAQVLPTLVKDTLPQDLTLTRRSLYDAFADLWFERQEKKLRASGQEIPAELSKDFKGACLQYCQNLAAAMLKAGVVEATYNPTALFAEEQTPSPWEEFLGPDVSVLRKAAPLKETEGGCTFIHKSLLEHFASKATVAQLTNLPPLKKMRKRIHSLQDAPTRPQSKRYTTFDIESTRALAKRWQEPLNREERDTLYNLAVDTIDAFSFHPLSEEIMEELIPLAAIPHADLIRRLLEQLIHPLDKEVMVDLRSMRALSRAVALVDTEKIDPSNFTICVDVLHTRVSSLHKAESDETLLTQLNALEHLSAALLDCGVLVSDSKVKELLDTLKRIPSKNLQVYAACASLKQAVLRLNTDENRLSDLLKRGGYLLTGIAAFIESVASYSPKKAVEGFLDFKKVFKTKGSKEIWYDAIRTAQLFIAADDPSTYREMELKPTEPHVQLALVMALDRGVRTTVDEMVRSEWIEEIIAIGASNPKIHGYVQDLVEQYHLYDAPEVRRACSHACFVKSNARWINIHPTRSYAHGTLLAAGKRALSWRLAQLKTAALNDPSLLQEDPFHIPLKATYYTSPSRTTPLDQEIRNFLASDEKRVFLLLGESGSGKSLSMKMLTAQLWQEHTEEEPIPLFISLTGIARTRMTLIEDALRKTGFTADQIAELKQNRDFIFILDGYDEMRGREERNLITTNTLLSWRCKVIITCRTQYAHQTPGSYKELFMPYDSEGSKQTALYEEMTTAPFTSEQIELYLQKFCKKTGVPWTPVVYLRYIERIPKVREMIETPFVLRILTEVLPGIVSKHGADHVEYLRLTRADFYESFVRNWFNRQLDKLIRGGWNALSPLETKRYYAYAVKLATQMHSAGLSEVRYNASKQEENPFAPFFANEPPLLVRARTACPLTISQEEDEVVYRFLHKSLLEYLGGRKAFDEEALSAEGLVEAITAAQEAQVEDQHDVEATAATPTELQQVDRDQISASSLNQRLYTQDMDTLRFWVDDTQQNTAFRDQLLAIIELSKEDPGVKIAAANAITVLVGAGYNFCDADLRGIRVPGALLDRGNFSHADLRGADLRGCSFREAFLASANCEGAHLEETDWGEQLIFKGHSSAVTSLAYSSDGMKIVSGSDDMTVRIWDVIGEAAPITTSRHFPKVTSVAFSPDGTKIASGGNLSEVQVWDAIKGATLFTLRRHLERVNAVAYSPDGTKIASGSNDHCVQVWDAIEGTALFTLGKHSDWVLTVAFNTDGTKIASGGHDCTVRVWDTIKRVALFTLRGHRSYVTSVAFSPDGIKIASGSNDHCVQVWDAIERVALFTLNGHGGTVNAVAYSSDGTKIASGSDDKTVRIWDAIEGITLFTFRGHKGNVTSVAFSPDGTKIASGSFDTTVRVWSAVQTVFLMPYSSRHTSLNTALVYSPNGKVIIGNDGGIVQIWDAIRGVALFTRRHSYRSCVIALSPNGALIASDNYDTTVHVRDTIRGELLSVLMGHEFGVYAMAFSPDGTKIALGGFDHTVYEWDAIRGVVLSTLTGHKGHVTSVAFSPNGTKIASGSFDMTVRVWDVIRGEALFTLTGHKDPVGAVTFSPDETRIASGSWDETICVWDAIEGIPLFLLEGHSYSVSTVAFSPDGTRIASGSDDKTVRIWDVQTRSTICTFTEHLDRVNVVAYNPDGTQLVSIGRDMRINMWRTSTDGKKWTLIWSSNQTLNVEELNITGAHLNKKNRTLLKQLGASESEKEPDNCCIS